ncbi:ribonuclease H-like domain-containing protein [Bacillus vallismortis]|uniref:Ribonuclease H-like domain-containing protein n=1 Tax=Bacillus vallismortis TaxID=72361 RepID=A0AAP3CMV5_BACVA|nr:ribonuclease H-like domain-containing protein [Bacillus vallismortis]MCY8319051.1 ribonuclease H-like domain-containing protein [Bacillus vallismortis]MCY8532008.1 ribonuclease H-like domain-containing protein [Bacillus vallismortis]MEC1651231.1 ribonuclease H-like domain-containing protein [Bacillus vallismortis]
MSLKGKLQRMKKHMVFDEGEHKKEKDEQKNKLFENHAEIPFLEEWETFGMKPFFFEDEYCLIREVEYPLSHRHGLYRFSELDEVMQLWNQSSLSHTLSAKGYNKNSLFFFDTETTGLGGGAGNTIFLLGHARVYEDRVIVKQHLLPKPGNEVALYQSFLSEVDITSLVTYNGKAFDWPQVKTRHTLIRDRLPKLPEFGHFDLLHGARRLWKHKMDRVSLGTVENEELGIRRQEDTPGYLAPMLYFHFIKAQEPELLKGVLHHNELDVLSLISLYIHMSKKILSKSHAPKEHSEAYAMAKWFMAHKETDQAVMQLEKLKEKSFEDQDRARLDLSLLYKKQNRLEEAVALWENLSRSQNQKCRYAAVIELAKFFEHQKKEFGKALHIAEQLLTDEAFFSEKEIEKLHVRIARLKRKYSS